VRRPILNSLVLLAATLSSLSCGGAQTANQKTASHDQGSGAGQHGEAQDEPTLPSCDDGSCFRCGDGICPKGFYCESNGGIAGCQWSTSCAKAPTCSCLQPMLKADARCSCEQREGVAFVTCSK
jgi:hypothetical protein